MQFTQLNVKSGEEAQNGFRWLGFQWALGCRTNTSLWPHFAFLNKKRILCEHDCSLLAITNSHLGARGEIESLEAFWGVERDPSSPTPQSASPVAGNVLQDEDIGVSEELTVQTTNVTSEASRFSVVEAPPLLAQKMKKDKVLLKKAWTDKSNYPKALIPKSFLNFYINCLFATPPGN